LQEHRQDQRQGQQHGEGHGPALVAQAAFAVVLGGLFILLQAGTVASAFDRSDQDGAVEAGAGFDVGAFIGQVDADRLHAGDLVQRAFDPTCATGAGHAADRQVEGD
jgi:hypothetical protein